MTCDLTGLGRAVCQKYLHTALSEKSVALSRKDGMDGWMEGWAKYLYMRCVSSLF